jgi:spore coat polysaccharide biosynthesis protein SpsF
MKKKIGIIIEARSQSKRLPKKILLPLEGMTVLEYLINRLKKLSKQINANIIVATTINKEDKKIVDLAKKNKVKFYQGSEENVLSRVIKTAKKYKIDIIIRITSDCPLVDVEIAEQLFNTFMNNEVDLVTNAHVRSYPDGMDVEIISTSALAYSSQLAKKNREFLEHVTLSMKKYKNKFRIINHISPKETYYPNIGLTLDEKKDYELIKKIIFFFKKRKKNFFSCKDIINLMKTNKELLKINHKIIRTKYSV